MRACSESKILGYTLVEVVTAISLLAILTSVSVPYMSSWKRSTERESIAQSIESVLLNASIKSKTEKRMLVLSIHSQHLEVRDVELTADILGAESTLCSQEHFQSAAVLSNLRSSKMLEKFTYTISSDFSNVLCFLPDGTSVGGSISIIDGDTTTFTITKLTASILREDAS